MVHIPVIDDVTANLLVNNPPELRPLILRCPLNPAHPSFERMDDVSNGDMNDSISGFKAQVSDDVLPGKCAGLVGHVDPIQARLPTEHRGATGALCLPSKTKSASGYHAVTDEDGQSPGSV